MHTRLPRPPTHRSTAARLRRIAAILAAITIDLPAQAAIVPAAFAKTQPDGGPPYLDHPRRADPGHHRPVITGAGMPGWQIIQIAVGAALAAAAIAVALDRGKRNCWEIWSASAPY